MILVDANLLLYAYDAGAHRHAAAKRWLEQALSGPEPVRFAWVTLLAFLRIGTHPTALASPFTLDEALGHVDSWLDQPAVGLLDPSERHWPMLAQLSKSAQVRGPMMMNAHLAALAVEHGAVLCTADRDFARFQGLQWRNPLE